MGLQVLGPLEVRVGDEVLELGNARLRTLLALLAANVGRVTTVGTVVSALWGADAPENAHQTVRASVSRLRKALAPAAVDELIVTRPGGYLLQLPSDAVV